MKYKINTFFVFIFFLNINACGYALSNVYGANKLFPSNQLIDSTISPKQKLFHDPCTYIDFQFPKGEKPLITTQFWFYVKKFYVEARHNYEDRKTVSLYFGRSFKIGGNGELEIIPAFGGSVGIFNGLSPSLTIVLETQQVRGFSQNQYSFKTTNTGSDFYFNWSALLFHTYKPLYLGASLQTFIPNNLESQIYYGPMFSIKKLPLIVEVYAYNFWSNSSMWALGLQYYF